MAVSEWRNVIPEGAQRVSGIPSHLKKIPHQCCAFCGMTTHFNLYSLLAIRHSPFASPRCNNF